VASNKKKYYVVWEGNTPGIYDSWEHCQREIKGYANAKFRAFTSLDEARKAYKDPSSVKPSEKSKKTYYYVVWHGFRPGIYTDWNEVLKQISGFNKAIYKTFGSKKLAEQAFSEHPDNYRDGDYKKTKDLSDGE
jgi:ribonuclease HI